jgi:hypothetical protein
MLIGWNSRNNLIINTNCYVFWCKDALPTSRESLAPFKALKAGPGLMY